MSENSGPAGQGKTPSKPSKPKSTPSPKPTTFDLNAAIRGGVQVKPAFGTANPYGLFGVGSSNAIMQNYRSGERSSVYDSGRFTYSLTPTGISASDSYQPENPLEQIALIANEGNRKRELLSPNENLFSATTAASYWLSKNPSQERRNWAYETLVAKGYITGEEAKLDRNSSQASMVLANALSSAVTSISVKNYNRINAGMDMLSFDEGLIELDPNTSSTTSGSSYGGKSVQITRQEFDPADYRIAVDQAYTQITGQAADEDTLDTYIKVLQKLEASDPMKTVSKTTGSASNSKTVTKQTGGVSSAEAEDLLLKQALKEPETEYYQKATTFMDYFTEAMKSKVNL